MKKFFKKIFPLFRNKYFIAPALLIIWLAFFDDDNLIDRIQMTNNLKALQEQKEFLQAQIKSKRNNIDELSQPEVLEKIAREKYFMKKPNEDIFYISEE